MGYHERKALMSKGSIMAETLGSYNQFLEERGLEHGPWAIEEYSFALHSLRVRLAEQRGISLEELHSLPGIAVHNQTPAA